MRSALTLILLLSVAAIAIAAPDAQPVAQNAPIGMLGGALLLLSVIAIGVESVRRLP